MLCQFLPTRRISSKYMLILSLLGLAPTACPLYPMRSAQSLIIPLMSVGSVLMPPFSFLILVICILFFFFFLACLRVYQFLLIFKKKKKSLWFHTDFAYWFPVFTSIASTLIHIISSAYIGFNLFFCFQFTKVETWITGVVALFQVRNQKKATGVVRGKKLLCCS